MTGTHQIRVLMVDDHPILRSGIAAVIQGEEDILLVGEATNGDKQHQIVTFAYCINRWQSRNLALRLIALGYTNVYWYRGGWEAWDAHDLPKAPLAVQFLPPH